METVYIVGIVAAAVVIVGVVWLLRDRIIGGRFGASATEKKVEAEFRAASPRKEPTRPTPAPPEKLPSVDISGNWLIGANVVRVWQNGVRIARNLLLGRQRVEVKKEPPSPAPATERKRKARRRK
jgi:hypothetical protein